MFLPALKGEYEEINRQHSALQQSRVQEDIFWGLLAGSKAQ
jgi:hypothetical protein